MIDPVQITNEERKLLLQHFRKAKFGLTHERAQTVLLFSDGYSPFEISKVLYRDEKTVREWVKSYQKIRLASLFPKYQGNTNASKLTKGQKKEIARVLLSPPKEDGLGLPKAFWDVSTLRNYLVAHFGVIYQSPQSYHYLFKLGNFSFKLPGKFDLSRKNDKEIKKRIKEIKEEIQPYFKNPDWEILVGDESRIVWEAIIRRCWLPKGQKTILKVERENVAQSFAGFLNLKTGKPHLFPMPWQNQKEIIKVLRQLKKKYPGKKICLVWDNAPWHKGKLVREKLKKELSQFYLLAFPPYAPDTNPQEHVWKWSKDQISNIQFSSMKELISTFRKTVMGRNYPYQI